jgi:hypothetical protein
MHFSQEILKLRNVVFSLRVFYVVSDVLEQAAEISIWKKNCLGTLECWSRTETSELLCLA